MSDLIKELYQRNIDAVFRPTKEARRERAKCSAVWERLGRQLGQETQDALWDSAIEFAEEEDLELFRQGFRLGAQMMLELM